ncbi:MAG: alpha-2-macroglobulin [Candidatus Promineifilaceae bacterium]
MNISRFLPRTRRAKVLTVVAVLLGITAVVAGPRLAQRLRTIDSANGSTFPAIAWEAAASLFGAPGVEASAAETLAIRLSAGQAAPPTAVAAVPVTRGTPLSPAEIAAILERLPELTGEATDQQDFQFPPEAPPPLTGETISAAFPPPLDAARQPEVPSGPLQVLRYAPEGDINVAPFLNVTFNQPMVPLTSLEALAAEDVPVRLTPAIPGVWKWLSPQTLSFAYQGEVDRFPKATEYTVEIPAGTQSVSGNALAETVSWTFRTPPPQVVEFWPQYESQPTDALMFVAFDQLIDPAAVLSTIRVETKGQALPLRLATTDEVAAVERVQQLADSALPNRWLAFRTEGNMPAASEITVTIGPGVPSAEGPRRSEQAQSYNFSTYYPLVVSEARCSWDNEDCTPLSPMTINFNNPLDRDVYQESWIEITPALPGAVVDIYGGNLTISGPTQGRINYDVTLSADIQDIFGQKLGKTQMLRFEYGSAPAVLSGPDKILVTLDPSLQDAALSVYTINQPRLEVRAYAVQPSDWPAYQSYLRQFNQQDAWPTPPGEQVIDETIAIDAEPDQLTETAIDLQAALDGDTGHLIVIVAPPGQESKERWERQVSQAWVQVTQIALDAFADPQQLLVWATDLQDGAPLANVTVTAGSQTIVTDENGVGKVALDAGISYLTASRDADTAILPGNLYYWEDYARWQPQPWGDELRWYVFDDRQMYRPGEEVHVKGWLRRIGNSLNGDVSLADGLRAIRYQVTDPFGNEILSDQTTVSALGGFDFAFTLPEAANLGYFYISMTAQGSALDGQQYSHSFQVQEFRRPEFEVSARNESAGPFFLDGQATVAVSANYYAGGPLPNAEVAWQVTSAPASYTPPHWPDFTFGVWTPWWWYGPIYYEETFYRDGFYPDSESQVQTFSGVTDATGTHYLQIDFQGNEAMQASPQPYSIMADATVIDVNRQAWSAGTTLLVHPANWYVGLRSQRYFVQGGQPLDVEVILVDLDGNAIAGQTITVTAARLQWRYGRAGWGEEVAEEQTCTVASAAEPVSCSFATTMGGTYRITAVVQDELGRKNQSQITRWVSGGERPPARTVEQEEVTLIPSQQEYQPSDTAEILVQAPFGPGSGLLTVSRSGILYTESFTVDESGTATLRVPISEAHIPNLNLQVDVVGAAERLDDAGNPLPDLPPRPAYASGSLTLNIPPYSRTLSLTVTPQESALSPGAETTIDLHVTDVNGQPTVNAEVALVVVDEAILALTGYQMADPLAIFYTPRPSLVDSSYSRAAILLANPAALADQMNKAVSVEGQTVEATRVVMEMAVEEAEAALPASAAMARDGDDSAAGAGGQPIQIRTDFNPLAVFAPAVTTDANGRAQVAVKLPDNLTRYRVMAVAVSGGQQFGLGESSLTARLPLMVRPSAPRFLNFGDQFEFPIVLQNQTNEPLTVDVALRATNLELTGDSGVRVTVPANDRVEVRFPAATQLAGTVRFQAAAVSGVYADAASGEFPVYTPATTEAFAAYGVLDEGAVAQPVVIPAGLYPQFGGLEIQTSSTALQALTDAVLYLTSYPYECSEQLASRILGVAALRDVLTAFAAEGLPSPAEMEAAVVRDIDKLAGLQNDDGGFPIWERGRESIPFYSVHVTHALARAQAKGFDVPASLLDNAQSYLRNIEQHYPEWYGQQIRWGLSAYALYVRHLLADTDAAKARQLYDEAGLENLPLEAVAWLWQILLDDPGATAQVAEIARHIQNRAVETSSAANFTTSYGEDEYLMLHSNRRTDAVILDALIAADPTSDLIPKVVNGLLAHRDRGRWNNTQENVFVLLALDNYFNTFEAETPDFVAQIWLGGQYAGSHAYAGRTTERHETDIPMSYLADLGGSRDLILNKEGTGRLYYRLGLTYAPTDLALEPLDRGFTVLRAYEAVDNPEDVTQDADGVWHIRPGARVRVRITMVAANRRYHVALVDPLPAGLEIVNPALAVSSAPPDANQKPTPYWWWWGPWYEHQNLRDYRAEAFTSLLWDGVYEYSYVARATTPGTFVVPPAKAEEMYTPEVFGRSGSDTVIVEP